SCPRLSRGLPETGRGAAAAFRPGVLADRRGSPDTVAVPDGSRGEDQAARQYRGHRLKPRPAACAPTGPAAERYDARVGFIAPRIGAKKLGYNITAVPGKRAYRLHSHELNEEMFFVFAGIGEIRIGEDVFPRRAGDIIACPTGGPETMRTMKIQWSPLSKAGCLRLPPRGLVGSAGTASSGSSGLHQRSH